MVEPDRTHIAQILLPEELSVYVCVCVTLSCNQNSVGYFQPFKKWSFLSLSFLNKKLLSHFPLLNLEFLFFGF